MATATQELPATREFMTREVIGVTPEMDIYEAIGLLLEHRISGAPVVVADAGGKRLVGIISEKDCLSILTNGAFYGPSGGPVEQYMSINPKTVSPDTDIFTVAGIFIAKRYRRLPVVQDGFLVGVVSRRDVLDASRRIWGRGDEHDPPDPGYLTEAIKAKLGASGLPRVHHTSH